MFGTWNGALVTFFSAFSSETTSELFGSPELPGDQYIPFHAFYYIQGEMTGGSTAENRNHWKYFDRAFAFAQIWFNFRNNLT
jgi:hypothetical protein